jgi:hypothetical protein
MMAFQPIFSGYTPSWVDKQIIKACLLGKEYIQLTDLKKVSSWLEPVRSVKCSQITIDLNAWENFDTVMPPT